MKAIGKNIGKEIGIHVGSQLNYSQRILSLLKDDIYAYWLFNEENGSVAFDKVNDNNAVYGNVVLNQQGFDSKNKSVKIDTNTDYINIYNDNTNTEYPRSEGTFMIWFKVDSAFWTYVSQKRLLHVYVSSTNYMSIATAQSKSISIYYAGNATVLYKSAAVGTVSPDDWSCLVCTWSIATSQMRLFLNGMEIFTPLTLVSPFIGSVYPLRAIIGNFSTTSTQGWDGYLSNALIVNRPVTSEEVYVMSDIRGNVIFEGDSRSGSYPKESMSYRPRYIWKNLSVSGSSIEAMELRADAADAEKKATLKNVIVIWIGVNSYTATPQQMFDGIKTYCLSRLAAGYKVVLCTEIDARGVELDANNWHTKYIELNTLIRADNSFYHRLADLGSDVRFQDATNTTYFNVDGVHLTDLSTNIIGGLVKNQIDLL